MIIKNNNACYILLLEHFNSDADMDILRQKLQKAYMRRDHYAQLYQQTKTELDETKQQLNVAQGKIKQLETQSKLVIICV